MRRVLICGDRLWWDFNLVDARVRTLDALDVVIEGEAKGADRMARQSASAFGLEVKAYPSDWSTYGRAAGPIRNRQMIIEGEPTEIWAFHDEIEFSKGTRNMCDQGLRYGLKVTVFSHECPEGKLYAPIRRTT